MKRLLLVDGHSVVFRSFFAFIRRPLRNSRGMNTSAVYGFAGTLKKLLAALKPDYCAVVFDAPGRNFRHERFEEYKIQRPPVPEELPPQIPIIKEMVAAWGLRSFEIPGVEADDVLGTLAKRFAGPGLEAVLATSDKDMLQLVGGPIVAYDPWKEQRIGPAEVKERLGVEPGRVVDLLALSGDDSDNIPGVPGVGPKRARDIIGKWENLDKAIENDERVKPHADVARLSRELATIHIGVEVVAGLEELRVAKPDSDRLRALFGEMEFRGMMDDVPEEPEVVVVTVSEQAADLPLARAVAVAYESGKGLWLSLDGENATYVRPDDRRAIEKILSDAAVLRLGYDLKSQVKALHKDGLMLAEPLYDVGVAAWLADPNRKQCGLGGVALQVLGKPVSVAGPAEQAALSFRIYQALGPQVLALGLGRVADEIEMPLVSVLAAIEERGVKVDTAYLGGLERELSVELSGIEKEIHRLAGHEFNVASPKQLGEVLFGELKLAKGKKTKSGFSTSVDVLGELAAANPIVASVLRYRELTKLCGTYLGPLAAAVEPGTGRVHANLNQTGAATGRLSSSDPNLQNIPIRTELGRKIRGAFVAEPGNVLVSADYSQIELRVLAHLSGDERLAEAFRKGEDIHAWTAAAILGKKLEDVNADDRRLAKMVNYGLVYGMGDYGLSWRAEIPVSQARAFLDEYMLRFAGVARWREQVVEEAKRVGFVRTISGRSRPTPGIADRNRNVAEATKRYALNAPVQGSAADIIKQAMIRLEQKLRRGVFGIGMILQVHDELLFEVESGKQADAVELVRTEMERAWQLSVPLVVDVGTGRNWGEAH